MLRLFLLTFAFLSGVPAATLFSQPPKSDYPTGYAISSPRHLFYSVSGAWRAYDNFSLSVDATITDIAWWGVNSTPSSQFELSIHADGLIHGQLLFYENVTPVISLLDLNLPGGLYLHRVSLMQPFVALANTQYWLAIYNSYSDGLGWGWMQSQVGDGGFHQSLSGLANHRIDTNLAFELSEVPEPGFQALVALCLLAVAWTHHYRPYFYRARSLRMKSFPRRNRLVQIRGLN